MLNTVNLRSQPVQEFWASSSCCVGACTCHHTGIARHPLPSRNNQITGLIFSHYKVPHVLAWAQKTRRHAIGSACLSITYGPNAPTKEKSAIVCVSVILQFLWILSCSNKRKKRHREWWRLLQAIDCRHFAYVECCGHHCSNQRPH